MYEKTRVASALDTLMLKFPSKSEIVPFEVPFSVTVTPGSGPGFDVANEWLGATRLSVAAMCLGRAERALQIATEWAATREQFGQTIGKFQGVSFKLADISS